VGRARTGRDDIEPRMRLILSVRAVR
jgi:hypothetical protein